MSGVLRWDASAGMCSELANGHGIGDYPNPVLMISPPPARAVW